MESPFYHPCKPRCFEKAFTLSVAATLTVAQQWFVKTFGKAEWPATYYVTRRELETNLQVCERHEGNFWADESQDLSPTLFFQTFVDKSKTFVDTFDTIDAKNRVATGTKGWLQL